jgi:hypothetical protein
MVGAQGRAQKDSGGGLHAAPSQQLAAVRVCARPSATHPTPPFPQLTFRCLNRELKRPNANKDTLAAELRDALMPIRRCCAARRERARLGQPYAWQRRSPHCLGMGRLRMNRGAEASAPGGSGAYGGRMRILADSMRLAQPTAPRVHARVRSGVPVFVSVSSAPELPTRCLASDLPLPAQASARACSHPPPTCRASLSPSPLSQLVHEVPAGRTQPTAGEPSSLPVPRPLCLATATSVGRGGRGPRRGDGSVGGRGDVAVALARGVKSWRAWRR